MKPIKYLQHTPCGIFPVSEWQNLKLEGKTDEEIFAMCDVNGFIDPIVFETIICNGKYGEYKKWKERK